MTERAPPPNRVVPDAADTLARAITEFNSWRFYDCHETLEDAWRELGGKASRRSGHDGGLADFYQGIIKVAAGFHHLLRGNHKGTVNLLSDALRLLEPFQPSYLGVDVQQLTNEVGQCLARVQELPPDRLAEFDRGSIPRIEVNSAAVTS